MNVTVYVYAGTIFIAIWWSLKMLQWKQMLLNAASHWSRKKTSYYANEWSSILAKHWNGPFCREYNFTEHGPFCMEFNLAQIVDVDKLQWELKAFLEKFPMKFIWSHPFTQFITNSSIPALSEIVIASNNVNGTLSQSPNFMLTSEKKTIWTANDDSLVVYTYIFLCNSSAQC